MTKSTWESLENVRATMRKPSITAGSDGVSCMFGMVPRAHPPGYLFLSVGSTGSQDPRPFSRFHDVSENSGYQWPGRRIYGACSSVEEAKFVFLHVVCRLGRIALQCFIWLGMEHSRLEQNTFFACNKLTAYVISRPCLMTK